MGTVALPNPTPRRRWVGRGTAWAIALVALLVLLTAVISGKLCGPTGGGDGAAPGGIKDAKGKLDPDLLRTINTQAARFKVDPYVIGGIAMRETNGGKAVACSGSNACGAMQLMPAWWASNHCDGDRDGRESMDDIDDNVCAAIKGMLKLAHPLKRRTMTRAEVMGMAMNYCGACQDPNCGGGIDGGYCEGVARNVQRLGGTFATHPGKENAAPGPIDPGAAGQGAAPAGSTSTDVCQAGPGALAPSGSGKWKIAPGSFTPEVPIVGQLQSFLDRVAQYTSKPFILTTGSAGHSRTTTNGSVSEHSIGRAGDFGSAANGFPNSSVGPGSPKSFGDELASAALIAIGLSPGDAAKNEVRGGITNAIGNFQGRRIRVQVIWRSNNDALGGDHTNHVHIGVKDLGPATHQPTTSTHLGP